MLPAPLDVEGVTGSTDLGDDGLLGGRAIHKAGGRVLAESESSCVVYGMPRCVEEAGICIGTSPLIQMPTEIIARL